MPDCRYIDNNNRRIRSTDVQIPTLLRNLLSPSQYRPILDLSIVLTLKIHLINLRHSSVIRHQQTGNFTHLLIVDKRPVTFHWHVSGRDAGVAACCALRLQWLADCWLHGARHPGSQVSLYLRPALRYVNIIIVTTSSSISSSWL